MKTKQAIRCHGPEVSEELIGSEDRIIGYEDGSYGWQARGTDQVCFPGEVATHERAIADYMVTGE